MSDTELHWEGADIDGTCNACRKSKHARTVQSDREVTAKTRCFPECWLSPSMNVYISLCKLLDEFHVFYIREVVTWFGGGVGGAGGGVNTAGGLLTGLSTVGTPYSYSGQPRGVRVHAGGGHSLEGCLTAPRGNAGPALACSTPHPVHSDVQAS